jgi:hypothetical protein
VTAPERVPETPRALRCVGGPLAGERHEVPAGATGVALPLARTTPDGTPVVAVYRVQRRRRGRGVGFEVLVHVRNEPPTPPAPSRAG